MSATKANINWSAVSHGMTSITRISQGSFGYGGKLIKFKGDVDQYPTVIACTDQEPHASFTSADVGTLMNIPPGTDATLSGTLNDAKSASGGAVVFSLTHAVLENVDTSGSHAQFGQAVATWQAWSTDGSTPPLSFTRS